MTALALWFGAAVVVGLAVGACIRWGDVDQVAEETP